jgi:hypothetical protein
LHHCFEDINLKGFEFISLACFRFKTTSIHSS